MGWATYVNTNICFNKQTYNNRYDVEDKIQDYKDLVNESKQSLLMLASMNPKDLIIKDCEGNELDIISSIKYKFDELIELYEESLLNLSNYELLLKDWHKRSGDFIKHDSYYRYIGESDFIFEPNTIYGVNSNKEWDGNTYYYVDHFKRGEFYKLTNAELNKYFKPSTEEEYNKH